MAESAKRVIKVHPDDNVAIVVEVGGLAEGEVLNGDLVVTAAIPQGHKVALADILIDEPVVRYAEVIGTAVTAISRGDHVNEENVRLPEAPSLDDLPLATRPVTKQEPLDGYTFEGYRNPDGSVGTRNVLGITTSVQCVAGTVDYVVSRIKQELLPRFPNVDYVVGLNHSYGCGVAINAPAAIVPIRTLKNITHNPNFGNEVMVIGLGCEKLQPSTLIDDQPVRIGGLNDQAQRY
ncbi:UxaA family hydrolase [Franzmannia qiaohouensis]|uniref:UxaA family hydrolase n=1 Tax=Franzmannia qiaohouensis TaxID=1329370 RepID=A0ABU1HBG1_9GAMM|nr:UxaA family hydrolase [Halomonas qiaohouensis]MDR5904806.1 UxaA family hydrolase [Halomonas qiaohouensis]